MHTLPRKVAINNSSSCTNTEMAGMIMGNFNNVISQGLRNYNRVGKTSICGGQAH